MTKSFYLPVHDLSAQINQLVEPYLPVIKRGYYLGDNQSYPYIDFSKKYFIIHNETYHQLRPDLVENFEFFTNINQCIYDENLRIVVNKQIAARLIEHGEQRYHGINLVKCIVDRIIRNNAKWDISVCGYHDEIDDYFEKYTGQMAPDLVHREIEELVWEMDNHLNDLLQGTGWEIYITRALAGMIHIDFCGYHYSQKRTQYNPVYLTKDYSLIQKTIRKQEIENRHIYSRSILPGPTPPPKSILEKTYQKPKLNEKENTNALFWELNGVKKYDTGGVL